MAVIEAFKERMRHLQGGFITRREMFWKYVDRAFAKVFNVKTDFYYKSLIARLKAEYWHEEDSSYHMKDVRFPEMDYVYSQRLNGIVALLWTYLRFDDRHDEEISDYCCKLFGEEPYVLVNDSVNVIVEAGDIVIDAGSWVGDFAAYASVKGADKVYAFEPTAKTFEILKNTAELNGNIIPVNKGLSDEASSIPLYINTNGNTGSNSFMLPEEKDFLVPAKDFGEVQSEAQTVRLDDFVRENNLPRVDFIKADIEGFERHMLAGAQETLARFAPKLALCTYHLPDDPEVMAGLIKQANPKYNIVQKRKKLFASVPKE